MKAVIGLLAIMLLVAACASEPEPTTPEPVVADVTVDNVAADVDSLDEDLADIEAVGEDLEFEELDNLEEELNFG